MRLQPAPLRKRLRASLGRVLGTSDFGTAFALPRRFFATHEDHRARFAALTPEDTEHFAAIIDPNEFGALLRAIEDYQGDPAVQ